MISADRILVPQLEGNGQFVEIQGTKDDKILKAGMACADGKKWIVVCVV